ncbi:MAG: hypothetical protein JST45_04230 [Bacteroidetes bacterium]|nr:hypothetical protein [Bacteroidota bacterium]
MSKRYSGLRALLLLPCLGFASMAVAGDKYGGEFRFTRVAGLTYSIELQLYSNPNEVAGPPWAVINFGDGVTDTVSSSSSSMIQGNCSLTEVKTYMTQHTYSGPGSYSLTAKTSTRIPAISNIPGSVNVPLCVPALLVVNGPDDSSPIFMNGPYSSYFNGTVLTHDPQAYDSDGDSLSFDLVVPQGQDCQPIMDYLFPDEVQPGSSTMAIDPHTGVFQWDHPQMPGYFDIAIRCTEWRNSVMLGAVVRDMTLCVPASLTGVEVQEDYSPIIVTQTADGQWQVSGLSMGPHRYVVMDALGRIVKEGSLQGSGQPLIETQGLSDGTYVIKVANERAQRMVVIRR